MDNAQKEFLMWLSTNFPVVYQSVVQVARSRGQLGWLSSIVQIVGAVASVAPAVINANVQKKAIKLQLEQMRQGMQPLPNEQVGLPEVVPVPAPAVVSQQVPAVVSAVEGGAEKNNSMPAWLPVAGVVGLFAIIAVMR